MDELIKYYLPALVITIILAYFFGCFNGAVIVSKYILKDDVRNHGSGNAGLTNFYRTFGGVLTLVVIFTDFFKGMLSVLLGGYVAKQLGASEEIILYFKYFAAVGCQIGHMFPVTFKFKGGKGVLSGGAIALMLDWRVMVAVWAGFLILVVLTRYVSLGSIWAGISFIVANTLIYFPDPVIIVLSFILGGQLLWGHRSNIKRLLAGEESKFHGRKKE
ncbi:MAG: glycerol-3-phosphate acyltransferase [Eubacteriales bacterium]